MGTSKKLTLHNSNKKPSIDEKNNSAISEINYENSSSVFLTVYISGAVSFRGSLG